MCTIRLLHTDFGQSDRLVATPRLVVSDRPSFRKFPFICLEFGHSESHGALSPFVDPRQLCQGCASLDDLPYGFVWLLTHERFSLPHHPASAQQGISNSYFIRLPCCSLSRLSRPKLLARKSGSSIRTLTTCSIRLPAFPMFTCIPLSYSLPGSFPVTLIAIVCAVMSFQVIYRFSSRPLNLLFTLSFIGECKVSGTRFFTPCTAWSLPHFQLVSLASVSIATVQLPIPQLGPRLHFRATPLVHSSQTSTLFAE